MTDVRAGCACLEGRERLVLLLPVQLGRWIRLPPKAMWRLLSGDSRCGSAVRLPLFHLWATSSSERWVRRCALPGRKKMALRRSALLVLRFTLFGISAFFRQQRYFA